MDKREIIAIIASNIQLSKAGQDVEHAKLDFKKEWYNLKDEKGVASVLKDILWNDNKEHISMDFMFHTINRKSVPITLS